MMRWTYRSQTTLCKSEQSTFICSSSTSLLTWALRSPFRTKPDADLFAKPMRTYGKRPAAKLRVTGRRTEHATDGYDSSTSSSTIDPSSSVSNVAISTSTNPIKESEKNLAAKRLKSNQGRSILNYYKPIPAPIPSVTSEEAVTESAAPLSPCLETTQPITKRRRILKIRPTDPLSPHTARKHAASTEALPSEYNEDTASDQVGGNGKKDIVKPPTARLAAAVQTTLNISSKPSFSECKVCDTVWNPLYPDDEKYHKKRHAAVLRAKKRKSDALD